MPNTPPAATAPRRPSAALLASAAIPALTLALAAPAHAQVAKGGAGGFSTNQINGSRGGDAGKAGASGNGNNARAGRPPGGDGAAGAVLGGGGGGANGDLTQLTGGKGGAGGSRGPFAASGGLGGAVGGSGGGGGGAGVVLNGDQSFAGATIKGGDGGKGGDGIVATGSSAFYKAWGGGGGGGGAGIVAVTGGQTVTIDATTTVTGGAGGAGGAAGFAGDGSGNPAGGKGADGAGGAGVIGSGLTLVTYGAIIGGMGGDGTTQANAVSFIGGANTLSLGSTATLTGNIGLTNNAGLTIDQSTLGSTTLSNVITGDGTSSLIVSTGTNSLTLTGTNTYTGGTTVTTGSTLVAGNSNALGTGRLTLEQNSTLGLADGVVLTNGITIIGDPFFNVGAGATSTIAAPIDDPAAPQPAGFVEKTGGGVLILSGANTYTGGTHIVAGTIRGGAADIVASSSSMAIDAGAAFDLGGFNQTVKSLSGAGGVTNTGASATLTNQGASSTFSGAITDGAGKIALTQNGSGTLTLSGANTYTGATKVETGVLKGGAANSFSAGSAVTVAAAGTLDLGGFDQTTAAVANDGRILLGSNTLTAPTVTNAGGLYAVKGAIAGNLTNTSLIDLTGGAAPISNSLTINGAYAGGGAMLVAGSLTNGGRAGQLIATGAGSGNTAVVVTPVGARAYFAAPILVAATGPGGSFTLANASALRSGLLSYSLRQLSPGQWYLVSDLQTGPLTGIGAGVASAITSASTGFFVNPASIVPNRPDAKPTELGISLWSRGAAGRNDITSTSVTMLAPDRRDTSRENTRTLYNGYQFGADVGLFNIENRGVDAHVGVTGGQYSANAYDLIGGTSSRYNVPFVGVYSVISGHGFFADLSARHDFWNVNVTNAQAGLNDQALKSYGWAGTASAGYRLDVVDGWFIEPSAGVNVASVDVGAAPVSAGTTPAYLRLDTVRSTLGRAGVRVGKSMLVGKLAVTPLASANVWREFEGNVTQAFVQDTAVVPMTVTRAGTFAQLGLGLSARLIDTGWTGFLRGNYRNGGHITGASIDGGLAYQF